MWHHFPDKETKAQRSKLFSNHQTSQSWDLATNLRSFIKAALICWFSIKDHIELHVKRNTYMEYGKYKNVYGAFLKHSWSFSPYAEWIGGEVSQEADAVPEGEGDTDLGWEGGYCKVKGFWELFMRVNSTTYWDWLWWEGRSKNGC